MVKRTFQPHGLRRKRTHGFRSRKRKVLRKRRGKGRWRLGL